MSWYYTRESGDEGQVLTDEGTPPGKPLTEVLKIGRVPMAVALEVIASLADILTIAEEDDALHGDVNPGDVYVDGRGSVSLSGYGPNRPTGRAPEEHPILPSSEVYGLGIVMFALLSNEPMGAIPKTRDAHDDVVVDRLIAVDWSEMGELAGRDPVIHFLCSMLAHDPAERPTPLDVANVLSEVAIKVGGSDIRTWAASTQNAKSSRAPAPDIEEVLASPQKMGKVFNKTGQYSRRQVASAKGECTAFWSRDKISAMLDDGHDQLAASAMFESRDLQTMLNREPPSVPPPSPGRVRSMADSYSDEVPWSPDATISGKPQDPDLQVAIKGLREAARIGVKPTPPPSGPPAMVPVAAPPPVAAPLPVAQGPVAVQTPVSPPPQRSPSAKPFPWLPVLVGLFGMGMLLCMFAVAGLAYMYLNQTSAVDDSVTAAAKVEPPAVEEPKVEAAPEPKAKPRPRSTPKATSKKRAATAPKRKAAPATPAGEFEVTFISMAAKASIACGDGQSGSFVGRTRRKFSGVTTCRIDIGDAKGAIQVRGPGTTNCSVMGTEVRCVGP